MAPLVGVGIGCIILLSCAMAHSVRDYPPVDGSFNAHLEAEWLYERGQYRASADCYRQILRHNPDDAVALNNLAWIQVEHLGIDLRASLKMAQRAVELRWHTPEFQDTLGWAYYKLGQPDRAVAPLRLAEQFGRGDPIFPSHLGEVYAALGRRAEARAAYQRALELDPTCEEARRGLDHLDYD